VGLTACIWHPAAEFQSTLWAVKGDGPLGCLGQLRIAIGARRPRSKPPGTTEDVGTLRCQRGFFLALHHTNGRDDASRVPIEWVNRVNAPRLSSPRVSEAGATVPDGPRVNIKRADVLGFDFAAPLQIDERPECHSLNPTS